MPAEFEHLPGRTTRIVESKIKPEFSLTRKLAVLSHFLPPSPSGQAMVLYRLLKGLNPDDYCVLSHPGLDGSHNDLAAFTKGTSDQGPKLPAPYYFQPPGFRVGVFGRLGLPTIGRVINTLLQFFHRAKFVKRVLEQEKCNALLACSGDLVNIPVSYLTARRLGIPFYAYIFDDYMYQWDHFLLRRFAQLVELIIMKRTAGIIVPNEFLAEEYRRRYQVDCTVIHNPHRDTDASETFHDWPCQKNEIRIVYTGAIYSAHYDSFRNLQSALRQLDRPEVRLHVYTAQPREDLEREEIRGAIEYHSHLAPSEICEVQRQADILFLPLAFDSRIPETIRTSAPGKMGEYLASGRPILVHAPPDSFVSWYFREQKCGVVVDSNDPLILKRAIECILDDSDLRQRVSKNAGACAHDFSRRVAQTQVLKFLNNRA